MILFYRPISETKALVGTVSAAMEVTGENQIEVAEVNYPDVPAGKIADHFVNPQTGEQWFEFRDIPLTPEQKLEALETENANLKKSQSNILLTLMRNGIK